MIRQVPNTGSFGAEAQLTQPANDAMARANRILSLDMTFLFLPGCWAISRVCPGPVAAPDSCAPARATVRPGGIRYFIAEKSLRCSASGPHHRRVAGACGGGGMEVSSTAADHRHKTFPGFSRPFWSQLDKKSLPG